MPLTTIADLNNPEAASLILRARGISGLYDQFIAQGRGDKHTRLPGIHASEVHGCKRKIVYSLLAYPPKENISKNWRQRFQMGHAIHAMLQTDFEHMAAQSGGLMDFEREVLISPALQPAAEEWFINSSCDGVFTFRDVPGGPTQLRLGLEIKSEAPDGFAKLREPKEAHIEQAHVYMKCLNVPLFWFLYMNKGNQNNTGSEGDFLIPWDQKVWDGLEARFRECHDFADRLVLPEREESMLCQFCGFSSECQPPSLTRSSFGPQGRPWKGVG